MAGESVNEILMEIGPLKKFRLDEEIIKDEDTVPELSDKDRLVMFQNNHGLLEYYLGLRKDINRLRSDGDEDCFCDPRDSRMCDKIKQDNWRPTVTLKAIADMEGCEAGIVFSTKQTALDEVKNQQTDYLKEDEESSKSSERETQAQSESFVCGFQGCNAEFNSLRSHESHYHTNHNFVCHVCKRILVSNFLLEVHLEENHDSYFQVLCLRIDMYRCLVESCPVKFRTAELRKDHLVKVHKYPSNFSFHKPIKQNRRQKGERVKKSSEECNNEQKVDSTDKTTASDFTLGTAGLSTVSEMDVDISHTTGLKQDGNQQHKRGGKSFNQQGRGKNRTLPTICFGRGSQRAFQPRGRRGGRGRHWYQTQSMDLDTTVDIEKIDFTDMSESLVN